MFCCLLYYTNSDIIKNELLRDEKVLMDTSGYITDNNIENIDEMREKADNYLTALAQIYDEIFEF